MKPHRRRNMAWICSIGILAAIGMGFGSMTASATSVDDVIAHAYAVGLPESQIQQCINQYGGGTYTSEQCDQAIALLDQWAAQRDQAIQDTVDQAAGGSTSDSSASGNTNGTGTTTAAGGTASQNTTTAAKPSKDAFIQMSLEEKVAYINSLPDEERTQFMEQMSNEERNSFLKELDTDKQLEIISSLIDVGDAFGVSFSVDSVSDDGIAISARDENGNLVDVTTFGNTVEETGIPYTIPVLVGGGAILLAAAGIGAVVYLSGRNKEL